jgi:hypothetical protein
MERLVGQGENLTNRNAVPTGPQEQTGLIQLLTPVAQGSRRRFPDTTKIGEELK